MNTNRSEACTAIWHRTGLDVNGRLHVDGYCGWGDNAFDVPGVWYGSFSLER